MLLYTPQGLEIKLHPGMILRGNPYMFLPGNSSLERLEDDMIRFSGSYNQGELPCATCVRYEGLLRKLPDYRYECLQVTATNSSTLRSESHKATTCGVYVPDYYIPPTMEGGVWGWSFLDKLREEEGLDISVETLFGATLGEAKFRPSECYSKEQYEQFVELLRKA